uniref:G_PROTEIN_RECEP_F1_2 domain-containing protein n=1 Tax=Heterorhabditis bacteriophora TaxID=37862 RepID=A0A1I7WMJ7_HETBA
MHQISYVMVLSWVFLNSRASISGRGCRTSSLQTGCETVDTVLTRTSGNYHHFSARINNFFLIIIIIEWNPLKTFSLTKIKETKDEKKLGVNITSAITEEDQLLNIFIIFPQFHISRALWVSFLLVTAYIVCWLPYNLLSLIHLIDQQLFNNTFIKLYFLHELMVFNSVINPYLYGLFSNAGKHTRQNNFD